MLFCFFEKTQLNFFKLNRTNTKFQLKKKSEISKKIKWGFLQVFQMGNLNLKTDQQLRYIFPISLQKSLNDTFVKTQFFFYLTLVLINLDYSFFLQILTLKTLSHISLLQFRLLIFFYKF